MAFIITGFAGIATLIGILPLFLNIKNKEKLIASSCAFASGVMISIAILDLIPDGISKANISIIFMFLAIILGIVFAMSLDILVDKLSGNNLYKVGILSMIIIILHNIPEGIITYMVSSKNILLGSSLALAIAIHNIPEGISIAIPIYFASRSKIKAILYTFIAGVSELFGAIISYLFLTKYMNDSILGLTLIFIGGMMISLAYNKLLPESINYDKKRAYIAFSIGFIFMIISLLLNNLIF